ALARGVGREQDAHFRIVQKGLLSLAALFPAHPTVDDGDRLGPPHQPSDLALQVVKCVAVFGEEHELLAWGGHRLRNRSSTVGRVRFANAIREPSWREDLAEELRELEPFRVLAAATNLRSESLQARERLDLELELRDGVRGGRLVEDLLLGRLHLVL